MKLKSFFKFLSIGLVTDNRGSGIIKRKYSKRTVYPLISLFLIANTINTTSESGESESTESSESGP